MPSIREFIDSKLERLRLKKKNIVQVFGTEVVDFNLADDGPVKIARWLHPKEQPKEISQQNVNQYKSYIKRGDMVIDIGAHTGDTALVYAAAAGKDGIVLALEPNRYVYEVLKENAEINSGHLSIHPINFAATEEDGEFEFLYSDNAFCNGGNLDQVDTKTHNHNFKLKVKGLNLQNYLYAKYKYDLRKLSFLKTDTEGFDYSVLKSLSNVITEYKPVILTEVFRKLVPSEKARLFQLISDFGYDIFMVDESSSNLKGKQVSLEEIRDETRHIDLICTPTVS